MASVINFSQVLTNFDNFDQNLTSLFKIWQVWSDIDKFDQSLTSLTNVDNIDLNLTSLVWFWHLWLEFDEFEQILTSFDQFWQVWPKCEKFDKIWWSLILYDFKSYEMTRIDNCYNYLIAIEGKGGRNGKKQSQDGSKLRLRSRKK